MKVLKGFDKFYEIINARPLAAFCAVSFAFIALSMTAGIKILALLAVFVLLTTVLGYIGKKISAFFALFLCAAVLLGSVAASISQVRYDRAVSLLAGKTVTVEGSVISIPKNGKFYFEASSVRFDGGEFDSDLKIYVSSKKEFELGDRFTAVMRLYMPKYPEFDMSRVIAAKGAPLMGSVKNITEIKEPKFGVINSVRKYILFLSDRFFTLDAKALFRALTVGDRSLMDKSLTDALSGAGISHIAAISGLHISLLGYAVYELVKRINKRAAAVLSALAAIFFAEIAGGSPSAVRAAIMFSFYMAADAFFLSRDSATALSLAAFLMAVFNPYVIFDMGFILSFLSIAGIMILAGKIKEIIPFLPERAKDAAAATISAQIFTIPVTMLCFKELSLYSVAANVVISFVFPYALYLCFILSVTAFVPVLSGAVAGACAFLLNAVASIARMFSSLPFGTIAAENIGNAAAVCCAIIVVMFFFRKKLSEYALGCGVMFCAAILAFSASYKNVEVYALGENSEYMTYGEKSVILTDTARTGGENTPRADAVIVYECEGKSAGDFSDILSLSGAEAVYLPEGAASYTFANEAKRRGVRVLFYPKTVLENETQSDYAENLLKHGEIG